MMRLLMGILKNLVYIFVVVIALAFLAMVYLTYFDPKATDFLNSERVFEIQVVDPLYGVLQKTMLVDKGPILEW